MNDIEREPYFKTDDEYRQSFDVLCKGWRARPSHEATTDWLEWVVGEVFRERTGRREAEREREELKEEWDTFLNESGGLEWPTVLSRMESAELRVTELETALLELLAAVRSEPRCLCGVATCGIHTSWCPVLKAKAALAGKEEVK